ncbi:HDIG domain-containing protein [Candidatus Bathyarchaeota archaeon]|nr:HDIG domain-containing protein [Candidatus Bathyarchaeota archaeon]
MVALISKKDALRLIEDSSRRDHMLLVGKIMAVLAGGLGGSRGLWETVGVLHDVDYDQTVEDRSKHGVVAANMLRGKLPEEALYAVMSHDHRAGFRPFSELDHSLVFADALAVLAEEGGLEKPVTEEALEDALTKVSAEKPWIRKTVDGYPYRDMFNAAVILSIVL